MLKSCFLAAVITGASTVRLIRRSRAVPGGAITPSNMSASSAEHQNQAREEPPKVPHGGENGLVDFIYTFGASGVGNPALKNQRGDELCFNGLRTYLTEDGRFSGRYIDAVAYITHPVGLYHSQYPVRELEVGDPDKYPVESCRQEPLKNGTSIWHMPLTGTSWWLLHWSEKYLEEVRRIGDEWFTNMTKFASVYGYMHDNFEVADMVRQHGWRLIGYAREPVEGHSHFAQVAHLLQQDHTMDCTVTFQGTDSMQDWAANIDVKFGHFCGLADQDESCVYDENGDCKMRHPRGAFVHRGFANRLRAIANSSEWKQMIKPMLQFCRKVYTVGHSLGGALAELFTTCVSKEMQPGQYGYEDHELFAWKISAHGPQQMVTATYAEEHMFDDLFGDALLDDLAASVPEAKDAVHGTVEAAIASDGGQ